MNFYLAVTDNDWFKFLSKGAPTTRACARVNFWQPGGNTTFKAIAPGEPFLFKLHSPYNYIVGGHLFTEPVATAGMDRTQYPSQGVIQMPGMSAQKVQEFLNYLDQEIEHQWNLYRSAKQAGADYAPNEKCEARRLEQTRAVFLRILNSKESSS